MDVTVTTPRGITTTRPLEAGYTLTIGRQEDRHIAILDEPYLSRTALTLARDKYGHVVVHYRQRGTTRIQRDETTILEARTPGKSTLDRARSYCITIMHPIRILTVEFSIDTIPAAGDAPGRITKRPGEPWTFQHILDRPKEEEWIVAAAICAVLTASTHRAITFDDFYHAWNAWTSSDAKKGGSQARPVEEAVRRLNVPIENTNRYQALGLHVNHLDLLTAADRSALAAELAARKSVHADGAEQVKGRWSRT